MSSHTKHHRHPRPKHAHRPSLYGTHAVREALLNPARQVQALYLTATGVADFEATLQEARAHGLSRPAPTVIDKKDLDKLCPPGAVHQGVALATSDLEPYDLQDLIIAGTQATHSTILMLDQVTDPHNVGALLRSACAFGATGVVMQRRHAPDLNGVLAKTACGAIEHIKVAYETNLSRALESLQEAGYFSYGLDERGPQTLGETAIAAHHVLVLGAEGTGLRRLVREHCDALVRLPTQPPIASLNVSNAGAVALYAVSGQA
jgi:23S rRNA (guanosine2251-2'-O)-methyltransferase